MGSPLSWLLADIFLNNFENKYIFNKYNRYQNRIILYKCYIDDIFLTFNGSTRQLEILQKFINNIHNKIRFTLELEKNNSINFLDLTITKVNNKFTYKIYRKLTTTSTTIHAESYHPQAQKMAAYNSFVHRLLNTPLDEEDYINEVNTLKYIAIANGYQASIIDSLIQKQKCKIKYNIPKNNQQKTYISTEFNNLIPYKIKNQFSKYNIITAFKTNNSIRRLLSNKKTIKIPTHEKSRIYKMICNNCSKFYLGQTGRSFGERFTEHLPKDDISKTTSNFAKHLMNKNHNITSFDKNCIPIHYCNKGAFMDAIEEYEIYYNYKTRPDILLNDKLSFKSNTLYDTAINLDKKKNISMNLDSERCASNTR